MTTFRYLTTSEDPSIPIEWLDYAGAAVDLSSGTWSIKLVNAATNITALTKTSGVTGYASLQGTAPNRYNAVITWSTGELDLAPGEYRLLVAHTVSGREKVWRGDVTVIIEAVPS